MREFTWLVTSQDEGVKLESILKKRMQLSRGRISSLKFSDGIRLNGAAAHTDRRVTAGQVVSVLLPDGEDVPQAYPLPLSVLFEDEDLLIVDKPAPLPSIRSSLPDSRTLENAVYYYLGCPERFTYRPVNRLDKGTSGIMVIAKNAHVQHLMQQMLHTDAFARRYFAVVDGCPGEKSGVIDLPIGLSGEGTKRCISEQGKPSVTRYCTLENNEKHALLLLQLETGRTHQIRVHLWAKGCPVTGDYLYGREHPLL